MRLPILHELFALLEEGFHYGTGDDERAAACGEAIRDAWDGGVAKEPPALRVVLCQPVEGVDAVDEGVIVDKGVPATIGSVVPRSLHGVQDLVCFQRRH